MTKISELNEKYMGVLTKIQDAMPNATQSEKDELTTELSNVVAELLMRATIASLPEMVDRYHDEEEKVH